MIQEVYIMIENYIEVIKLLDNYFDAIMVVDDKFIIRHYKTFYEPAIENVDTSSAIGKTPFDIFKNIDAHNSTLYQAIKDRKTTLNNVQKLIFSSGKKEIIVDNTIPIIANNKIIGAINTAKYLNKLKRIPMTNSSNIIAPCETELFSIGDIIGVSDEIINLKEKILKVSKTDSNIFIYGNTGTGKEMVAQAIHTHSDRKHNIFISQNCAAIPENLLESIFFGTVKGSYTDATDKAGLFEIANGGTIFLDEINSMSIGIQAKLLKIIEEQKIRRIGSTQSKPVNVRILTASNISPIDALEKNLLRQDLFYRLGTVQINIPDLVHRYEDISILTVHFIHQFNLKFKKQIKGITEEVQNTFFNYHWPGNVRELKNAIESAFNFCNGDYITINDIPEYILHFTDSSSYSTSSLNRAMNEYEKNFILKTSKYCKNISSLAAILKISRQALYNKLKKHNLLDIYNNK